MLDHELAKARDREAMRRRERERKLEVEAELRKVAVEQLTRRHVEWEKERELVEYYAGMGYRVDAEQLRQLGLLQEPATAAMEEKSDSRGTSSSGLWGL